MAGSPGKLLSSVCLEGDDRDQSSRSSSGSSRQSSSSCVNLFIHLFDWNRRLSKKGLLFSTKRLLAAEESGRRRGKNGRKMKMDERLPMAKLLLIADENRRNCGQIQQPKPSPVARLMGLEQSAPTSAEIRSLQELLHLDQEDSPKMLQEFLHKQQQEQQQKQQRQDANRQQEALLNLLIQEVKGSSSSSAKNPQRSVLGFPERPPRTAKSSSSSSKAHRAASAATVGIASSGCGGFSKRPSGLFLEAAAKILDPRNPPSRHGARSLPRGASRNRASEEEFAAARVLEAGSISRGSEMFSARRNDCVASAPCSPVSDQRRNKNNTREISSCTSIRSLMELFLDDLEEDMTNPSTSSRSSSSRTRKTVSEPCSPIASCEERREFRTVNLAPSGHSPTSSANSGVLGKMVCVDELEEHDYISFRNFLTGGGRKIRDEAKAFSNIKVDHDHQQQDQEEEVSCAEEEDEDDEAAATSSFAAVHHEDFKFMVHNPLFDDNSQNYSENASSFFSDNEQDEQGLEEILKSILYQSSTSGGDGGEAKDLSRLTWLPDSSNNSSLSSRDNYLFNKDSNSEADDSSPQMDNDSVELTSESNCGEDCGQPSPVSVLDSPFDDDLTRKGGKSSRSSGIRKRLDFADESPASTSSSCIARLQRFTLNTLEEAEEYVTMILEESGICYHADVTLMVPDKLTSSSEEKKINGGVVSSSVFERLEDRVRVQQLIEHLEACGSTSRADQRAEHHSLESLRAHYESYHECRSRRRMVFDFVNEVLNEIVDEIHGGGGRRGGVDRVHAVSGKEVVERARRQVMGWKREEFESIHELVDKEIEKSSSRVWREFDADVCEIEECCEQLILRGMVEELARDLLA